MIHLNRAAFIRSGAASVLAPMIPVSVSGKPENVCPQLPTVSISALVLSGGTAHGAYEAGVVSQLRIRDFDFIVGTSIGALNGALFSTQKKINGSDEMVISWLWNHLVDHEILTLKPDVQKLISNRWPLFKIAPAVRVGMGATFDDLVSLAETEPVRKMLRTYLLTDDGVIEDFSRPLIWTTTDLSHGCAGFYYRLPKEDYKLASGEANLSISEVEKNLVGLPISTYKDNTTHFLESLRASSALPGVFEPAVLPDSQNPEFKHVLIDGGVVNNTPMVLAMRAARIAYPYPRSLSLTLNTIVLREGFAGSAKHELKNILGIGLGSYALMSQRLFDEAARQAYRLGQRFENEAILNQQVKSQLQTQDSFALRSETVDTPVGNLDRRLLPNSVRLRILRPSTALKGSPYDFKSQDLISWNFELGVKNISEQKDPWVDYVEPPEFCYLG